MTLEDQIKSLQQENQSLKQLKQRIEEILKVDWRIIQLKPASEASKPPNIEDYINWIKNQLQQILKGEDT